MKKLLIIALLILFPVTTSAATILPVKQGGTGLLYPETGFAVGSYLIGNGTSSIATTTSAPGGSSFSTTSADFWQTTRNFTSTTSLDFWKTVNNFFSTTSAVYWKSTTDFFSTTSVNAWKLTQDFFSTTSADYWFTTKTISGGSGSGPWGTSTSQVSGQLIVSPLNTTDIVTIGPNATSSAKFSFNPNTLNSFLGLASTTFGSFLDGFEIAQAGNFATGKIKCSWLSPYLGCSRNGALIWGFNTGNGNGMYGTGFPASDLQLFTIPTGTTPVIALTIEGANGSTNGYVGIGTSTPYARLSVSGRGVFDQDIRADYFTATSSTIASTFTKASTTQLTVSQVFDNANSLGANGYLLTSNGSTATWAAPATVDISSGTNLAVTAPIVLTGDTLSLGDVKQYPTFTYATTTWSGTTTIPLGPAYVAETWNGVKCFTDTGTVNVVFNDGTNNMNLLNASTTVGTFGLSTNNSFTSSEKRYVSVGTPSGSPTKVSCTVSKTLSIN